MQHESYLLDIEGVKVPRYKLIRVSFGYTAVYWGSIARSGVGLSHPHTIPKTPTSNPKTVQSQILFLRIAAGGPKSSVDEANTASVPVRCEGGGTNCYKAPLVDLVYVHAEPQAKRCIAHAPLYLSFFGGGNVRQATVKV